MTLIIIQTTALYFALGVITYFYMLYGHLAQKEFNDQVKDRAMAIIIFWPIFARILWISRKYYKLLKDPLITDEQGAKVLKDFETECNKE